MVLVARAFWAILMMQGNRFMTQKLFYASELNPMWMLEVMEIFLFISFIGMWINFVELNIHEHGPIISNHFALPIQWHHQFIWVCKITKIIVEAPLIICHVEVQRHEKKPPKLYAKMGAKAYSHNHLSMLKMAGGLPWPNVAQLRHCSWKCHFVLCL